ncbi:MAG: hypothetical protein Q9163_003317 [Psora crenata]
MARYISHTELSQPPLAEPESELIASLEKLVAIHPPQTHYSSHDLHGFYSGPTGISLLFFYLSRLKPDMSINGKRVDRLYHQYLNHSVPDGPVTPDRCGIGSETLTHCALTAAITRDKTSIVTFLSHIRNLLSPPKPSTRPASNEWLYGRAGALYLLRLVLHFNPAHVTELESVIEQLVSVITAEGPNWKWHGKAYLGAVHGNIGIIAQILLSSHSARTKSKLWSWLDSLLETQLPSGNFPSSAGKERDELVQFCHGGPGFVISLLSVRDFAPDRMKEKINAAIEKAREDIWKRGVLTKEPCLCHGASGNAIALDERRRGDILRWAQRGVVKRGCEEGWYVEGDDPVGLMGGEAGRAWVWMVAAGLAKGMISFSEL